MSTLIHEYEVFRIKPGENIQNMKKHFIHIVNHLITLGKTFLKEYLINKFLRYLNRSWQPKFIVIYEFEDLSFTDLATLFWKIVRT